MNAFVVAAARGIVVGDWNQAVRPQLPAVLGVPLVLADPASPAARELTRIARGLASRSRSLAGRPLGLTPA
jgi:hypothetical protein